MIQDLQKDLATNDSNLKMVGHRMFTLSGGAFAVVDTKGAWAVMGGFFWGGLLFLGGVFFPAVIAEAFDRRWKPRWYHKRLALQPSVASSQTAVALLRGAWVLKVLTSCRLVGLLGPGMFHRKLHTMVSCIML